MSGYALDVKNTQGGLGNILDLGANQNGARTFTAASAAAGDATGVPGDQVQIVISEDGTFNDGTLLGYLNAGDGPKTFGNQAGASGPIPVYRYVRTIRTGIGNALSPTWVVEVGDPQPSGAPGGDAVVANGGQAFGINWVVGPSDAFSLSLTADGNVGYLQTAAGALTLGTNVASQNVGITIGAGGQVRIGNSGAVFSASIDSIQLRTGVNGQVIIASKGTGGISLTPDAGSTGGVGVGVAAPAASGVTVDTPAAGTILIGPTTATTITIGGAAAATIGIGIAALATAITVGNGTGATSIALTQGTGGIGIGAAAPGTSGTTVSTIGTGVLICNSNSTGDANFGTGAAGADANAKTVRLGTGAAAKTVLIGSTNTTSATTLNAGSGGIQAVGAMTYAGSVAVGNGTGTLGAAAATVDITSLLIVTQTTPVVLQANMRTLAAPTTTTAGRRCTVLSAVASTAAFTVGDATLLQGVNLSPGIACEFVWNGTAWAPVSMGLEDWTQGAALTDAAAGSVRGGQMTEFTLPAATLSAGRVNTLVATAARIGDLMLFTRLDVTANTYTITTDAGVSTVMPASKQSSVIVRFNGTNWIIIQPATTN